MLKTILVIIAVVVIIASCSKSSSSGQTTTTAKTTIFPDLTAKQWQFDSVYTSYNGSGGGQLLYARGSMTNFQNFDTAHLIFNTNGTTDVYGFPAAGHYQTSYGFSSGDSTLLVFPVSAYFSKTQYQRILDLSSTNLKLYDSTMGMLEILAPQ